MTGPAAGPLDGIRVVDLTAVVLGPLATQTLGDMGADVIKVEPPEGDPCRLIGPARVARAGSYFANLNRNKRSIVLDLKQKEGQAALSRLIAGADVLVHNMRPGPAKRLGLDAETLRAAHPRLIHASASGWRPTSTHRNRPAYDDIIQGASGVAALNAGPDGAPRYWPTVAVDKLTGTLLASAIGMALFHRERTGEGQAVHVPMLETILGFLLPEHMWSATLGAPADGVGYPRMLTPHRRPYATRDGFVCVIAVSDETWRRLFRVIGRPELIDDPRFVDGTARSRNIEPLYAVLTEAMATRTTEEWLAALDEADVPNGPVNALADLFEDPYLTETGYFVAVDGGAQGMLTMPSITPSFSATPGTIRRPPPLLGEHTEEVLREAGCDKATIAAALATIGGSAA
jgi:crotonobetainyl-CoA:carnitine CoA-transferase CaiB-like acyl-CoA transferase